MSVQGEARLPAHRSGQSEVTEGDKEVRFDGQRVLVTGAGKGIGRTTARLLAAQGASVVALTRAAADLESLEAEIGCETIACDLNDPVATRAAAIAAQPIDLLV